jgi:hypothetical protein
MNLKKILSYIQSFALVIAMHCVKVKTGESYTILRVCYIHVVRQVKDERKLYNPMCVLYPCSASSQIHGICLLSTHYET